MAVLDDVEDLAIGTVFESRRIGEVGNLELRTAAREARVRGEKEREEPV